jgi:hypothetical protein
LKFSIPPLKSSQGNVGATATKKTAATSTDWKIG